MTSTDPYSDLDDIRKNRRKEMKPKIKKVFDIAFTNSSFINALKDQLKKTDTVQYTPGSCPGSHTPTGTCKFCDTCRNMPNGEIDKIFEIDLISANNIMEKLNDRIQSKLRINTLRVNDKRVLQFSNISDDNSKCNVFVSTLAYKVDNRNIKIVNIKEDPLIRNLETSYLCKIISSKLKSTPNTVPMINIKLNCPNPMTVISNYRDDSRFTFSDKNFFH